MFNMAFNSWRHCFKVNLIQDLRNPIFWEMVNTFFVDLKITKKFGNCLHPPTHISLLGVKQIHYLTLN
jgi:hypothetical protein